MERIAHKKLKIEVRLNPNQEWFKVGTLENISFQDAEMFIKNVQVSNPSLQDREYRIVEC